MVALQKEALIYHAQPSAATKTKFTIIESGFAQTGPTTRKITYLDSLSHKTVEALMNGQVIRRDGDIKTVQPVGTYDSGVNGFHIMNLDGSIQYTPDLHRLPQESGRQMFHQAADTAEFMRQRDDEAEIHYGFNITPRSADGAGQSLLGLAHGQIRYARPTEQYVARSDLKKGESRQARESAQLAVRGHRINQAIGETILLPILSAHPEAKKFLDLEEEAQTSWQGVHIRARASNLAELLGAEGFYDMVRDISRVYDEVAVDVAHAFTYDDNYRRDRIMKDSFEGDQEGPTKEAKKELHRRPDLRSAVERTEQIATLADKYPEDVINLLHYMSRFIKPRSEEPRKSRRMRFVPGFFIDFVEYPSTDQNGKHIVEVNIKPSIFANDGGVVEMYGKLLKRGTAFAPQDEIGARRDGHEEYNEYMDQKKSNVIYLPSQNSQLVSAGD